MKMDLSLGNGDESVSHILQRVNAGLPSTVSNSTDAPVLPSSADIEAARSSLKDRLPEHGVGFEVTASHLLNDIARGLNLSSLSPRYYGFVTGGVTPAALGADFLTSIYDQNVAVHLPDQTIATDLEARSLDLLSDLLQFDRSAFPSKTFTTGATASNILGLAHGREWLIREHAIANGVSPVPNVGELGLLGACAKAGISDFDIISTLPHSSIAKAASIVGLGRSSIVSLSEERNHGGLVALNMGSLYEYMSRRSSTKATILVVSAGEVNTGRFATISLKQMQELREYCDEFKVWLHVDGAFGLFARLLSPPATSSSEAFSPRNDEFSTVASGTLGLELADSITGDGHKFLNVPYDCGFFFSRHPPSLTECVFQNGNAAYLTPPPTSPENPHVSSPLNVGIENSRRFRALPVYASILSLGRVGYTDTLKRQIRLARRITRFLIHHPGYQVLPKPSTDNSTSSNHKDMNSTQPISDQEAQILDHTFTIVLFRAISPQTNIKLVSRINETSKMYVSGTVWDDIPAARIAISNWRCDVERDYEIVRDVLEEVVRD